MKSFVAALTLAAAAVCFAADKPPSGAAATPAAPVKGQVLEVKNVQNYTYLKLKTKDGETWAAVSRADVKKGTEVTIDDPMYMQNFESRSLNRKFDRILLGSLRGSGAPAGAPGSPHAGSPHGAAPSADVLADVKVAKATGADARTIAEIVTKRADLKDKSVQVRGKVVKVTTAVLGKNWIHLRDGTGSDADSSNDLVVTTADTPKVGDVVVAKGTVRTDKDLGSGYAYKVLLEDAKLQK